MLRSPMRAPIRLRDMEEAQRAARRLCSRIVASAHLLDVPFTDAPDQSPWTKLKADMTALYAAVEIRFAAPAADEVDQPGVQPTEEQRAVDEDQKRDEEQG
jgi:hypothetical protein